MADRTCPFQTGHAAEQNRVDPRAPAHAVRQLVQQDGRHAPRALYEAFDAYNAEHSGGALKQSLILMTTPASPRAEGDYTAQDAHGIPSRRKKLLRHLVLTALVVWGSALPRFVTWNPPTKKSTWPA